MTEPVWTAADRSMAIPPGSIVVTGYRTCFHVFRLMASWAVARLTPKRSASVEPEAPLE
jgi:hypothetical protein